MVKNHLMLLLMMADVVVIDVVLVMMVSVDSGQQFRRWILLLNIRSDGILPVWLMLKVLRLLVVAVLFLPPSEDGAHAELQVGLPAGGCRAAGSGGGSR